MGGDAQSPAVSRRRVDAAEHRWYAGRPSRGSAMFRVMRAGTLMLLASCDLSVVIGDPSDAGDGGAGGAGGGAAGGGAGGGADLDAGHDAGSVDAGPTDGGISDAGTPDSGSVDAGSRPGETCQTAVRLSPNSTTTFSLVGYANDYDAGTGCRTGQGPDGVFVISVPGLTLFTASLFIDAGFGPNFAIRTFPALVPGPAAECDVVPRACVGSFGGGYTQTLTWANSADAGRDVFFIVDNFDVPPPEYLLTTALAALAPGETCGNPRPMTPGAPTQATLQGRLDD